jgi:hypothetical protein
MFTLNDISFGVFNGNLLKDMCANMLTKFTKSEQQKEEKMHQMGIGALPSKNFVEEKAPSKIQVAF